jgi:Zn finger protein HypA/HybF involved in hydrogenase expression
MHEHTFIQAIIEPIKNKENVKSVELEVGELAGITPSHLKEHLIDETGWEVIATEKKSNIDCECGYQGPARIKQRLHDLVIFDCPKCEKIPLQADGKDIKILKVIYK